MFSQSYTDLAAMNCFENCEEREAGEEFKFLTYNAYHRQGINLVTMFVDVNHTQPRVDKLAEKLADFDIIALQEVFAPLDEGRKE